MSTERKLDEEQYTHKLSQDSMRLLRFVYIFRLGDPPLSSLLILRNAETDVVPFRLMGDFLDLL